MSIWSAEIKELEKLYESFKGQLPDLEKELEQLIQTIDANVIMLYSRRCLEVIITDLCDCELKRPRKTEPLKGIIDKLHKEDKVPSHIISSMHGLNELSTYGAHPKDFDAEQVKPVLVNLDIIIKWYLKFKDIQIDVNLESLKKERERQDLKPNEEILPIKDSISNPFNYELPISDPHHIFPEKKPSKSAPDKYLISKQKAVIFFSLFIFLAIIGLWGWLRNYSSGKTKLTTYYTTIPVESSLTDTYGQYFLANISPDGKNIALGSEKGIQIRSISSLAIRRLEGTENSGQLAFSPDGQSLVFIKNGDIYKIGINGSSLTLVYSKGITGPGISWGIDGYIYFSPGLGSDGIWRVSSNGGDAEQITCVVDSLEESAHSYPQLLPDSKTLLFTSLGPSGGSVDSKIVAQRIKSNERRILIDKAIFGRYMHNGNILCANNEGNISILPFDIRKLKVHGEQRIVLSGINTGTWGGSAFISVSESGNLIFLPRFKIPLNIITVVDRSGKSIDKDTIPLSVLEKIGYGWSVINLSPSGDKLAINGRSYGSTDVWLLNLSSLNTERITFDPSEDEYPIWSPDGNAIVYTSALVGTSRQLFVKDLRGSTKPDPVRIWPRHIHITSWSSNGNWLAAHDYTSTNGTDCYAISVDTGEYISISSSKANELNGQFSPDNKWLVYQSDESGRSEIYIAPFSNLEIKRQISEDGGILPHWDQDGTFVYFISKGYMIAQSVEIGEDFKKGNPIKLFPVNTLNYDISPDGRKFYLTGENMKRPNIPLTVIIDWFEELKTK